MSRIRLSPVRVAVRRALLASALATAAASSLPAQAQDQGQDQNQDQDVQTVTVTGTRIQRPDFVGTSPIVSISNDAFDLSGEVQVETVLNSLPQLVPTITTTSNNPSNEGQANVDLRGLTGVDGGTRTLVLLDGTRITPSDPTGVVDLNTIPSALIEGVEILTGGASSTYGSDAIAGVVNIRLKRNFEGVQLNFQNNVTEESDGKTFLAEAVIGGNFAEDRGNAVVTLAYDRRDEVFAGARPFGTVTRGPTLAPVGSATIPGGRIDWGANTPSQPALDTVFGGYGAPANSVSPTTPIGFNADSSLYSIGIVNNSLDVQNFLGNTADPGFNSDVYSYNFGPVNYLQLPLERRQIAGLFRYDLTDDGGAEVYSRMMFTTYHADQLLAATPVTCANATIPGCLIPTTNPTIPAELRTLLESRANPTAPLNFTTRVTETGGRLQENNFSVLQSLLGVRGGFSLAGSEYRWDVYGSWGRSESMQLQAGNLSRSRLQNALNNPAFFAAQGCAQFNPFGEGAITPACATAVSIRASNILEYEQTNFVASITGEPFSLPAGPLSFAVGAEYREDNVAFRPDEFLASGDVVGFNANQPVSGRITVVEPFIESVVPLLSELPAIDRLQLELGARRSDYNVAGTADTYKVALSWSPVSSLNVRGSYNRAIRAPSVQELFLPTQENFPAYSDPCNANSSFRTGAAGAQVAALCQAQGIPTAVLATFAQPNAQARSFVGGNLDLIPEEADTYTYGASWQSNADTGLMRGFRASLDYFSYEIKDVIRALTTSSVIGRCFNQAGTNPTFDPANPACQLFTRNPANFGVTDVVTTQLNLSALEMDGIDLNVDWGLPLSAVGGSDGAGRIDFRLLSTYTLSRKQQETALDQPVDRAGTISQQVATAFPEFKAVLSTMYSVGDLEFRYNARYVDGMRVVNNDATLTPSTSAVPSVPSYLYHDLTTRWTVNDTFGVTLGVVNFGDKDPPIYTTNAQAGIQSNTDPSTYDVLGRRYFLSLNMTF